VGTEIETSSSRVAVVVAIVL